MPAIGPVDLIVVSLLMLIPIGVIGTIIFIAVRVSRLKPTQICPHCGGKLGD